MTSLALILLLIVAVLHATWNYWAERAGGGLPFVYLVSLLIVAGYVSVVPAWWFWSPPTLSWSMALAIFVSGCLKRRIRCICNVVISAAIYRSSSVGARHRAVVLDDRAMVVPGSDRGLAVWSWWAHILSDWRGCGGSCDDRKEGLRPTACFMD